MQRRTRRITAGLLSVTLLATGALWQRDWFVEQPLPERPITALSDGVFRVTPDYYETAAQLRRLEAVFLPVPPASAGSQPATETVQHFAGTAVCAECHADYVRAAAETAHALTCRLPTRETVLGAFEGEQARVETKSPTLWFEMEERADGLYQKLVIERGGVYYVHAERIDYSVGSGKLGQTYLYWQQDALYELPITYFTESGTWVNSPGYQDGTANFARPIGPACLHCHVTAIDHVPDSKNRYDPAGAVLGVTCERCHGPAREHVEYHRAHPAEAAPRHILNPAGFPPARQLDLCAQCHSGVGESLKPPFSYRPGEVLEEYLRLSNTGTSGPGGVHSANQRARLSISRCFQQSPEMTCTTCHDPHRHERDQQALFAQRCLKCHASEDCGVVAREGAAWAERCIDCHMPRREDTETVMKTAQGEFAPLLRDHFISIDHHISDEILREGDAADR